jgi:hypothetical protein
VRRVNLVEPRDDRWLEVRATRARALVGHGRAQ